MPSWDRADIKLSHVSKSLLLPLFLYRYVVSLRSMLKGRAWTSQTTFARASRLNILFSQQYAQIFAGRRCDKSPRARSIREAVISKQGDSTAVARDRYRIYGHGGYVRCWCCVQSWPPDFSGGTLHHANSRSRQLYSGASLPIIWHGKRGRSPVLHGVCSIQFFPAFATGRSVHPARPSTIIGDHCFQLRSLLRDPRAQLLPGVTWLANEKTPCSIRGHSEAQNRRLDRLCGQMKASPAMSMALWPCHPTQVFSCRDVASQSCLCLDITRPSGYIKK